MRAGLTQVATSTKIKRRSGLSHREARWGWFFISPWIAGFLFFTAIPVVASFFLSFTQYELITPPQWIGAKNYIDLFTADHLFLLSLYNTVYYVLFSVPLSIIFAFVLSMLLNVKLHGMNFYRTVFYLPAVTSGVAVSLLWMWLFNPQFGLINFVLRSIGLPTPAWLVDPNWSKPAFILMSLWGVGGTVVIFLAGLQGVPRSLYEAAEIDGANTWQCFWNITVPMMTPVIFFNLVMGMIGSFQVFTQAYVMTNGGPQNSTLFYMLYLFRQAFNLLRMGYAAAMAWVLFIIILILTVVQFKLADRWVYYETDVADKR